MVGERRNGSQKLVDQGEKGVYSSYTLFLYAAVIVVNKIDLLDATAFEAIRKRLSPYAEIGYELIYASTHQQHGMYTLTAHLRDKTSIFAGQSGVGKSSLIQTLLPNEDLRVGELSKSSGLGKHTTTVSVLYPLPSGGYLIDSPGVRAFGLGHVSQPRIALGFIEFHGFLGQCKYHNCTHLEEPHCAIKSAVERGAIDPGRYQRYKRIVQSLATLRYVQRIKESNRTQEMILGSIQDAHAFSTDPAARSGYHSIQHKGYPEIRCCVGIVKGNTYDTIRVT